MRWSMPEPRGAAWRRRRRGRSTTTRAASGSAVVARARRPAPSYARSVKSRRTNEPVRQTGRDHRPDEADGDADEQRSGLRGLGEQAAPGEEGVARQREPYGDRHRQHQHQRHREREQGGHQQPHRRATEHDRAEQADGGERERGRQHASQATSTTRAALAGGERCGRRGRRAGGSRPRRVRRRCPTAHSAVTMSTMTVRLARALASEDPARRPDRDQEVPPGAEPVLGGEDVTGDQRGQQRQSPAAREGEHDQRTGPAGGVHPAAEDRVRRE